MSHRPTRQELADVAWYAMRFVDACERYPNHPAHPSRWKSDDYEALRRAVEYHRAVLSTATESER